MRAANVDTPEVGAAETHKALAGESRRELVQEVLQMKTEKGASEAANAPFVDVVKAEKLVVVAVGVTDAEGKLKLEEGAEEVQVVSAFAAVPYLVVL